MLSGMNFLNHHKLLYIEDNLTNLKLVESIFEDNEKITLLTSTGGIEGLELAEKEIPDLILLDINLPGMNGLEVFSRLQDNAKTNRIPVIAVSANAMEKDIETARAAGFTDYITKPINIKNFLDTIRKVLGE